MHMFVSSNGIVFSPFVFSFAKKRSIVLCFLYCNVALFLMLCNSGFLTKYSNVRKSERKKKWNVALLVGRKVSAFSWYRESVIGGVCFSHFFMRFAGGLALVRVSGVRVSVIARCPQGESRLYYASVNPAAPSTPPPQTTAGHLPALSVPGVGHLQILFCLGAGHLSTPGPLASFWHARSFLSEYIYTEGFTGKNQIGSPVKDRNKYWRGL